MLYGIPWGFVGEAVDSRGNWGETNAGGQSFQLHPLGGLYFFTAWGAKADGSADDSSAIMRALCNAPENARISGLGKTFLCNSLKPTSRDRLELMDFRFKKNADDVDLLAPDACCDWTVRRGWFDGDRQRGTKLVGPAYNLARNNISFKNSVGPCTGWRFIEGGSVQSQNRGVAIEGKVSSDPADAGANILFKDFEFSNNYNMGLDATGGRRVLIHGGKSIGNKNTAIQFGQWSDVVEVVGHWFERCNQNCIGSNASNAKFKDNWILKPRFDKDYPPEYAIFSYQWDVRENHPTSGDTVCISGNTLVAGNAAMYDGSSLDRSRGLGMIDVKGGTGITIHHNMARLADYQGGGAGIRCTRAIQFARSSIYGRPSEGLSVEANHLIDSSGDGILLNEVDGYNLQGNMIKDSIGHAVRIQSSVGLIAGTLVRGEHAAAVGGIRLIGDRGSSVGINHGVAVR
jgi:hypothetical protein